TINGEVGCQHRGAIEKCRGAHPTIAVRLRGAVAQSHGVQHPVTEKPMARSGSGTWVRSVAHVGPVQRLGNTAFDGKGLGGALEGDRSVVAVEMEAHEAAA